MLLAILSGVLAAFAFPRFSFFFLAWLALLPLFLSLAEKNARSGFGRGFLGGFVFYGILLYWVPDVPAHYAGLPYWQCLLAYLALASYLASYWGVFGLVFFRLRQASPVWAYLTAPFLWVGLEYAASHLLTGFPWGLIGTSQYELLPLIQAASLGGVFAVSFLVVALQSGLAMYLELRKGAFLAVAAVLVAAACGWGYLELNRSPTVKAVPVRAAVIQGNPPDKAFSELMPESDLRRLFERHLSLSRDAVMEGAGLIVWPEFSVPLCFSCDQPLYLEFKAELERFVQGTGVSLLLGTTEQEASARGPRYFNTALALHPDLSRTAYHKTHLVPFGEYMPYREVFSFVEKLTKAVGEVTPGEALTLHRHRGQPFASPICYEIIFPDLVRRFVRDGAAFLVTITNDGWYGRSSAPLQHWAQAVMRAVENRRFLARAATTGVSGFVDPYGRVLASSELETQACLVQNITPASGLTFYARRGDILPPAGLTIGLISYILSFLRYRKGKRPYGRHRKII